MPSSCFGIGYSWGGYESLALPVDPEKHRTATEWKTWMAHLIRLSIGLEDPEDLIADLANGFANLIIACTVMIQQLVVSNLQSLAFRTHPAT